MASKSVNPVDDLLKKPLYVFDLPRELLVTLILFTTHQPSHPTVTTSPLQTPQNEETEAAIPTATSCNLCAVSFPNVADQREHVRSDLHRYNLKLRLRGNSPVTEADFQKLVGELDESISGSESDDSEDGDEDRGGIGKGETTLMALLKRQARISPQGVSEEQGGGGKKRGTGRSPLVWFKSPRLGENTSLGIYRAVFTEAEQLEEEHMAETLLMKQLSPVVFQPSEKLDLTLLPHVFLCMIGGGHFAAMVVSLAPQVTKQGDRHAPVLTHKTFHRYTTRRKQGGSQSANDAAKGAAHSAGSTLRRYNEAALEAEIRQLLGEWKGMIGSSELLFVRATGSTNRRVLFGPYDGQVLKHNDARLRGFPFSTRRATQAELMRAFGELTRVKISQIDEAAIISFGTKTDEAQTPRLSKPSPRPPTPKVSKEDETAILHTSQLQAFIRRSKAPALLSYLTSNSLSPNFAFQPNGTQAHHHAPTPLHLASSTNTPAVVLALLTKAGADPTALNGDGKPPFDLAGDRATRDAFRVARHELGESKWDWDAAHIPAPISKSDADARTEREKRESESAEQERRKVETGRLRKEDERRSTTTQTGRKSSGRALGAEKTGAERREEETRGMSAEMRVRLERERRARAAEERIQRMQQN